MDFSPPPEIDPSPSLVLGEDDTQIELLQRSNEIKRTLLQLQKDCGIAFYRPTYYQDLFHSSPAKRRGLFAGNRFGKSEGNAAETTAWMLGERPWYKAAFDVLRVDHNNGVGRHSLVSRHHPGGDSHPLVRLGIPPWPTKQLIITTNWSKVHDIWTSQESDRPGKLWKMLPRGFGTPSRNHEGVIDEVIGANGSLLKFMSIDAFKRHPQVAESSDWDRVSFDEPGPIELWKGSARGLVDRNGQGDFTLTSLVEMWIYDYFTAEDVKDNVDRASWTASIYDNPHLSDEAIARFALELTDDEKSCRLNGLPLELSGLVYKEFKRQIHILQGVPAGWRDYHLPPKSFILYCRVDPHPVTPNAVQFATVGPSEVPVICHEIWASLDADALADEVLTYVKSTGCFLANVKMDPAAWIQDAVTRATSIARTFSARGLFCGKASKDFTNGILKTRSALKSNRLLFSPNVRRTLWEISRYAYDPVTGKPYDKDDHMMENLRRFCIDSLPYFDPDKAAGFAIGDEEVTRADLSLSSI